MNTKVNETNKTVAEYNKNAEQAYLKALTMGSLKTPRATLADLAGVAVNDNMKGE